MPRKLHRTMLLLLVITTAAAAQQASPTQAHVSLQFDRPGLQVPHFTLTLAEDGTGTYTAEQLLPHGAATQHLDRPLTLSPATTAKIFTLTRTADRFHTDCASKAKNIADTGTKTLHYDGPEGEGSCVFNFSENKNIVALTDLLEAIAYTLDFGRKLDFDHRFDRLGLDADTQNLVNALDQGRAAEVGTIAHSLHSLALDPDVLERVRLRADTLLKRSSMAN